jgi:6-phosphogluconolactonase (cycloisomerase 2 family)
MSRRRVAFSANGGVPTPPGPGTLSLVSWVDSGQTGGGSYYHPGRIFITADGKHLYAANTANTTTSGVTAHSRDPVTGVLTRLDALAPMCTGYSPQYIVESPDAAHIYVAFGSTSEIKTYNRNATTGALTSFAAAPNITVGTSNSNGGIICISPDGAHIYAAANTDSKVYCFARDNNSGSGTYGKVTILSGQTSITPTGCSSPFHIVITKSGSSGIAGKYLYVGNFTTTSPQISCLVRDNNSGSGTYGQLSINPAQASIASPTGQPAWLCISPDDRHLYVACDKGSVTAYSINQSDGSLTQIANYTSTSAGPWCVMISPDGSNLYLAGSDNCQLDQFTRDNNPASGTFGQLTAKFPSKVKASPYFATPAGSIGPNWIAISPDGRHLYAPSDLSPYPISQFNIHQ